MTSQSITVALIQTKVGDDLQVNLDKTASFIKQAAKKGAGIVCLQELFAYRYFAQTKDKKYFDLAEPIPGRLSNFLSECAKSNRVFLVGGSIYEKSEDGKLYNTTLIYDQKGNVSASIARCISRRRSRTTTNSFTSLPATSGMAGEGRQHGDSSVDLL